VWHHNTLGFDECLGVATCDKSDETPETSAATMYQLPLVVRTKGSSANASPEVTGRVTVEVTNRRKLSAL